MNKRKKILAVLLASSCMAIGTVAVIGGTKLGSSFATKANDVNYAVELNASNGAVLEESLKTKSVVAKTNLTNDVTVDYKNMEVVNGKIGAIKAKGHYSLHDPVCAMSSLAIAGEATTGAAVVKYGKTSACLDGSVDLALAIENGISDINANYFRIEASERVVIESIEAGYTCSAADNGASATDASGSVGEFYIIDSVADGKATIKHDTSNHYKYATTMVIPDFVGEGADFALVTKLAATSSTGFFEGNSNLEHVYLPETIEAFDIWNFYTANKVKEFTLPYALKEVKSSALPKGSIETLNIHSKNLASCSTTYIDSSSTIKTINVSADVELLPALVSSWPSAGVRVNYEGTMAEWADLLAVSSDKWASDLLDVYCSDTVLYTVTLNFENATLNGVAGPVATSILGGKKFADPGKPVYADNAKMFDGWYTLPNGGTKVDTFPLTINEDVNLYAHFVDWPEGTSITNAKALVKGADNVVTMNPDAGIDWFYTSYEASAEEVLRFNVSVVASGYSYADPAMKVYNSSFEEVSLGSTSVSASTDVREVNTFRDEEYVKIHFNANEKYYIAFSNQNYGGNFYSGTFNVSIEEMSATNNFDYRYAADYTLGDTFARASVPGYRYVWNKFTASATGSYIMNVGATDSGAWASYEVGHFVDGVWTNVGTKNVSSGSVDTLNIDLVADEEYYVAAYSNTSTTAKLSFKISNDLPAGYNVAEAIEVEVDGAAVDVVYDSFSPIWHKFTVTDEDYYVIHYDLINGKTSSPTIVLYTADGETSVSMTTVSSANDKYAKLTAGTYYFTATASSYIASSISVKTMADGYGTMKPAAMNVTNETTALALEHTFAQGAAYRFVAPNSKFMIIKFTDSGSAPTLRLYKDGSTTYSSMSNKKLVYQLTEDEAYILEVTSGTAGATYNFSVEFAEELHDGTSVETAYILAEGVESEVFEYGKGVYSKFTPATSGDYVYHRSSTYSGTIACYEMDGSTTGSTITAKTGATNYDKVYTFEAGKTYCFYDYYGYGTRTATVFKVFEGYSKDNAIALTLDATTDSIAVANSHDATFYEFTAAENIYFKMTADNTTDAFALLDSNGSELKASLDGFLGYEVASGTKYLIKVTSASSFNIAIERLDPASVKDGSTRAKAIVWTPDAEGYMALGALKSGMNSYSTNNCVWYELDVAEAGTYELWTRSTNCDTKSLGVFAGDSTTYISGTTIDDKIVEGKTTFKWDFYLTFTAEVGTYYLALGTAGTVDATAKLGFAKLAD